MAKGEMSLNNEVLAQAAQLTADLVEADAFCSDMYEITSAEAEEKFLKKEAAMIYIGNWYTNSAQESLGEELEVIKMPTVPGAIGTKDYHGGGINGWMIAADTEYPDLAVDVAAWLGYQLTCYQPENATFSIEPGDENNEITETKQKVLDLFADKEKGGVAWDTLMRSDRAAVWLNTCSELFEGKLDGNGFVQTLTAQLEQEG